MWFLDNHLIVILFHLVILPLTVFTGLNTEQTIPFITHSMPRARRICEQTSTAAVRQPRVAHSGTISCRDWETGVSEVVDKNFYSPNRTINFHSCFSTDTIAKSPTKRDKSSQRQIIVEKIYLSVYVNELICFCHVSISGVSAAHRIDMRYCWMCHGKFDFLIIANISPSVPASTNCPTPNKASANGGSVNGAYSWHRIITATTLLMSIYSFS